jgi:hypothetical protein
MHTPSEIDDGDQFIDPASQSLAQRQFALETKQIVSFTFTGGERRNSTLDARSSEPKQPITLMAQHPANLSSLDGTNGLKLSDEATGNWCGPSIAPAGDVHAATLPPAPGCAGEQWQRQPRADRSDVGEFDKCEIGRDAYPPSNRWSVEVSSTVVAGTWLAFYVIAAIRNFVVSGN